MIKNGVIAFCGSKGSGKSTSATLFKELIQAPTEEIAIAGHLKEVCSRVFNVDFDKFVNPALKEVELEDFIVLTSDTVKTVLREFFVTEFEYNTHVRPHIGRILRTPRTLLQYIGTEVLHPIDPLIHVKAALKKKDPAKLTVITDLRFVAEFDYFCGVENFVPVYVRNVEAERVASTDAHPSERQLFLFNTKCRLLPNDEKTFSLLRERLTALIKEIYG